MKNKFVFLESVILLVKVNKPNSFNNKFSELGLSLLLLKLFKVIKFVNIKYTWVLRLSTSTFLFIEINSYN